MPGEEFIGEPIQPDASSFDARRLVGGAPDVPRKFRWRQTDFELAEVLERWKETGRAREGGSRQYLRKHWFRIRTTSLDEMKIYFERTARSSRMRKTRWWLYSVLPAPQAPSGS